jgi:outer membrane protein TolC
MADAVRRQARAALVPQVIAQGAFEVNGVRMTERTSAWVVGGQLRWSLSLGGSELARVAAATESRARARAQAEDARGMVHLDVVSALRRLESARARHAVGRAAVEQARESHRIIRNRFDAGAASVTDVLRASSATLDAEALRIGAVVDAMVSDAMLRRAVGR